MGLEKDLGGGNVEKHENGEGIIILNYCSKKFLERGKKKASHSKRLVLFRSDNA